MSWVTVGERVDVAIGFLVFVGVGFKMVEVVVSGVFAGVVGGAVFVAKEGSGVIFRPVDSVNIKTADATVWLADRLLPVSSTREPSRYQPANKTRIEKVPPIHGSQGLALVFN